MGFPSAALASSFFRLDFPVIIIVTIDLIPSNDPCLVCVRVTRFLGNATFLFTWDAPSPRNGPLSRYQLRLLPEAPLNGDGEAVAEEEVSISGGAGGTGGGGEEAIFVPFCPMPGADEPSTTSTTSSTPKVPVYTVLIRAINEDPVEEEELAGPWSQPLSLPCYGGETGEGVPALVVVAALVLPLTLAVLSIIGWRLRRR